MPNCARRPGKYINIHHFGGSQSLSKNDEEEERGMKYGNACHHAEIKFRFPRRKHRELRFHVENVLIVSITIERTDQIALRNIIWHGSTCFLCILVIILPLEERQYQRNTPFIWTLRGTITVHIIRGHRFSLRFMISHSCAGSSNNRFTMCTFKRDNDLFSFFNFNFNLVKTLLSICKVTSNTEKCTYPYFLSNIFNYERNACSNISYCIYVL